MLTYTFFSHDEFLFIIINNSAIFLNPDEWCKPSYPSCTRRAVFLELFSTASAPHSQLVFYYNSLTCTSGTFRWTFYVKKPNHDRRISKRLHIFRLSHVLPWCVCSLKGPCLEIPGCSAAYINSKSTWTLAWIAGVLQKWCFYCVSVRRKHLSLDGFDWNLTTNILLNCVNYDVSIHSQQEIYLISLIYLIQDYSLICLILVHLLENCPKGISFTQIKKCFQGVFSSLYKF